MGGFLRSKKQAIRPSLPLIRFPRFAQSSGLLRRGYYPCRKKMQPPVLLEKIAMKSLKTAYFEVTNAKYNNKPYRSTKARV